MDDVYCIYRENSEQAMMIVSSDYVPCLSLFKNQRHPTMLAWNSYRTHILMVELAAWRH
jgi:hypothetical protein